MARPQAATVDLKLRMKEPLRAQIEEAARARGVSMNSELVRRLEHSFRQENQDLAVWGGAGGKEFWMTLARVARSIAATRRKNWLHDARTFEVVRGVLDRLIPALGPEGLGGWSASGQKFGARALVEGLNWAIEKADLDLTDLDALDQFNPDLLDFLQRRRERREE